MAEPSESADGLQLSHWARVSSNPLHKTRRSIIERLPILGIMPCVGLFFAPAAVIGQDTPGGINFNVANEVSATVINN